MIYISGPWFVGKDGKGWPRVIETQHEDQIAILSSTLALHKCLQGTAKLIAAASDLLEVCKRIAPIIKVLEMLPFHRGAEPNSLADDLFKAIAKAEGQSDS